jgi:hypothetical protein
MLALGRGQEREALLLPHPPPQDNTEPPTLLSLESAGAGWKVSFSKLAFCYVYMVFGSQFDFFFFLHGFDHIK